MRFGVLGPLAVWAADGRPAAVPGRKTRTLLAALLVREGHPVSADRLVEDLWGHGELPGDPAAALHTRIWQLRKALEAVSPGARELLRFRDEGYALLADPDSVDIGRFAALTSRARTSDDAHERIALLSEGLALWRGAAFAGFTDFMFAQPVAARLEEARLAAVEALTEARIDTGAHAVVAAELQELVLRHPVRERLRALHMRALHASGRTGEALAEFQDLRARLADELGLDPGAEITLLHRQMLEQHVPVAVPAMTRRALGNLPASLTPLVGREDAVAALRQSFADARQVTLTGPGGVGKTRLALETAALLAPDFPDGTWLVELAPLNAAGDALDLVTEAVMTALDIRQTTATTAEHLADALHGKQILLVLDNCEHVLDGAAGLALLLLQRCPGVRLLATSQEPFGMAGEVVRNVQPLTVPDEDRDPALDAIARSSAVELFVARAAAAVPGFALDAGNAPHVAEICRRLDGIPLALELAAARVRGLGVHGIASRLGDRFRLLATGYRGAPPRHQTLRAMIDWSWDLLPDSERAVLRSLAVHSDGCTLEAAEAVCGDDRVLDLLPHLVSRSLVAMDESGTEPRYRLLESILDYSLGQLDESGERRAVLARHREYYVRLAERAAPLLRGPDQRDQLRVLDAEASNIAVALDHALQDDAIEEALELVLALTWYWFLRGRLREAGRSLETVLAAASVASAQASLTAQARAWHAGFTVLAGGGIERGHLDRVADELSRDVTDPSQRARVQWFLGFALFGVGDQAFSEAVIDQALEAFETLDDRWGIAAALSVRANQAHVRGDLAKLERDGRRSAAHFAAVGDEWGQLQTAEPVGALAEMAGDYAAAARIHREGLRMAEDLGLWPEASYRLTSMGNIAMLTGSFGRARECHERALRLATDHHFKPGQIHAEIGLGLAARREGRLDAAEVRMRNVLRWQSAMAFDPGHALALAELGFIAEERGNADEALRLHLEGWSAARSSGDPRAKALALEGMAGAHARAGRHTYAAMLLGAATSARSSVGMPLPIAERRDVVRITRTIRKDIDEHLFHVAHRHGAELDPEEAVRIPPDWKPVDLREAGPGSRLSRPTQAARVRP
ncbi:BTAD domain-containing putative transcriptional regulator [Promicromonospora umidemergens]|uniref:BTAD domain-containing putative transcriptional regulator n=1 Tax=Promicromonospora umidemergens TaxID=629679 RepID=UPI0020A55DDA|nr:BTAD domain-containing putative transcriptional regulator [Promicromonospora umidemergens]